MSSKIAPSGRGRLRSRHPESGGSVGAGVGLVALHPHDAFEVHAPPPVFDDHIIPAARTA